MTVPIFQVDAFSEAPFKGNPAGVCLLQEPADPAWMQNVATEMNLSETAFLVPGTDGFGLRWFTPKVEVKLCGHGTLASAHILWQEGILGPDKEARFHTKSGLLKAGRAGDWVELDFPARPILPGLPDWAEALVGALGVKPAFIGLSAEDILVEVSSEEVVRGLRPDFGLLSALPVRAIAVTSRASTPGFDFVSRFFAPAVGVDEDPVTGSAHCVLTPYWAAKLGRASMSAFQASRRGGVIKVRLEGERVIIAGRAVTVLKGQLVA